ncbi:MAG: YggS family pyridoxal phosphate-dependent enzyme [Candidatus Hodarchaeales archaeon]
MIGEYKIQQIIDNYIKISNFISCHLLSGEKPKIVIVTKGQPVEIVSQLVERLNHPIIGENRVQEALAKIDICGTTEAEWHFIGHLQSNKVKKILGKFSLIHSLDRLSLAKEIERRASNENLIVNCLLQIDICQDGTKFGIYPDEEIIKSFLHQINAFSHINVRGLMTIAPYIPPEEVRVYFRRMMVLFTNLVKDEVLPTDGIISMGMSNDYNVALEEGSRMIRLGTAIFGNPD